MALSLLVMPAKALLVSVTGMGEISEEGLSVTLTDAQQDPLTGEMLMELKGTLLTSGEVTVTIQRSSTGIEDEFCCAGACQAGNGELSEARQYTLSQPEEWFIHYSPKPLSDETITYLFDDGTEQRLLTVRFVYDTQDIEAVKSEEEKAKKVLKDGIMYIIKDNVIYYL